MNFTRNLIALALTGLVATTGMAMDKAEHTAAKDRMAAFKAAGAPPRTAFRPTTRWPSKTATPSRTTPRTCA